MKKLIFFLLIVISGSAFAQTTLWSEDFTGESNGATSGSASPSGTWSVTTTPPGTFSRQLFFGLPVFEVDGASTEGVWQTDNFSIATTGMATISIDFVTALTSSSTDYIRAYYKVDGGSEILFAEMVGSLVSLSTTGSAIVSGNNLQIVVRASENSTFGLFYFDNLTITSVVTLYSRKSGNWSDNNATTGTWSTTSYTGGACGCTPTSAQVAKIGNNFRVDLDASSTVGGLNVQNTGILRFNTSSRTLTIAAGLVRVESGGSITSSSGAITGEQIIFDANVGGASFQTDTGGSSAFEDLVLSSNATNLHYLTGGGTFSLSDDILIQADDATLTNNMTSTVSVSDRIEFSTGITGSTFLNNGTVTATNLVFDDDNNFFTNAATATFSGDIGANGAADDGNTITNNASATLSFANLNADISGGSTNGGDITILNSGTINQSGTFSRIANNTNATNDVNNLAGATWNYSGTGHDTDIRLLANNPTNTFDYSRSSAQQIITPVTGNGYNNLTLSNNGTKTALGSFSVSGNWSRTGSATFVNSGVTVTLNGSTTAQTIAAVGGETFSLLTINNTFGTLPQITTSNPVTVTGTLTMTSGIVNLSGNTFTVGSSGSASTISRTGSTTTNWMYGGSFTRFWLASTAVTTTNYGLFPLGIGSASSYRPVTIASTVNPTGGGSFTVTHTDATTSTDLSPTFNDGGTTIQRKNNAQFVTSNSGVTGGTYTINVTMTGLLSGTLSDIRLAVSNGATTVTTVGTHSAATGSASNPTAIRTGVSIANLVGDFRITSSNTTNTPLPVELISFDAILKGDRVKLEWVTASEINNDFFTIERSADGEDFKEVIKIRGNGTRNVNSNYESFDDSPLQGRSYYRLKQTDFDGTYAYSSIRSVENNFTGLSLRVFPNPSTDNHVNVYFKGGQAFADVPVKVLNMQGVSVFQSVFKADEAGSMKASIELNAPQGVYLIVVNSALGLQEKILVK